METNGQRASGATVLIVDDEAEIRELMQDFLEASGFGVLTAPDVSAARAALAATTVDCLLLDVTMPGNSGFDFCRQIRERNDDLPIIFLTARDGDVDKIRGFGLGCDDYIVKSAMPVEVVARIKAVLRRAGRSPVRPTAVLDFGPLTIDLLARDVRLNDRPVPVTAKEFDLLRLLAEHPRQVFTRDQLFEECWGEYGDRHTVNVHISRLRDKIEPDPEHPRYIVTVWGIGYRFEGQPS